MTYFYLRSSFMIHIMYGLPASGKTTLAMKLFELYCEKDKEAKYNEKSKITYLNLDPNDYKNISNTTDYGTERYNNYITIVDGFFKTIKDISTSIWGKGLLSLDTSKIIIHVFKQNKQACYENDRLRARKNLATNSINEGQEEFDIEIFKQTFFKDRMYLLRDSKISIEKRNVIPYNIKKDYTIYSEWLVGYETTNDFIELDNWLEENHPSITFLQYKKICKHIKTIENFTRDYYDEHDTRSIQRSIKISDIEKEIKNA